MKTKYRVSTENTYMGPIASVPDSLFVSIKVWLKMIKSWEWKSGVKSLFVRSYAHSFRSWSNRIRFSFYHCTKQDQIYPNPSTPIERPGNDVNNNLKWTSFTTEYYDCWLKSSTKGEIRFNAGHQKHTFTTCNRSIVSFIEWYSKTTFDWLIIFFLSLSFYSTHTHTHALDRRVNWL